MNFLELYQKMREASVIKIYRHINPDPDALGSQFGLAAFILCEFPNTQVYCAGELPERWNFLYAPILKDVQISIDAADDAADLIIILDTANRERIDGMVDLTHPNIIKIDHHIPVDDYGTYQYVDASEPAVSSILLDFLLKCGSEKTKQDTLILSNFLVGILGDTGKFSYGNMNQHFFNNISYVYNHINVPSLLHQMYQKTKEEAAFIGFLYTNIKQKENVTYAFFSSDDVRRFGVTLDFATGMVNLLSDIKGTDIWGIFCEDKEKKEIRCSLRSREISIEPIARAFGGGGHIFASGVRVSTWGKVDEILEALVKKGQEYKNER